MLNNRTNIIKQWLRFFLVIFCTIFVSVFAMMIMEGYSFIIDEKFIAGTYLVRQDWLTPIVIIFTNLCSVVAVASITIFVVIFVKDWTYKIFAIFNIGISAIVNIVIKKLKIYRDCESMNVTVILTLIESLKLAPNLL